MHIWLEKNEKLPIIKFSKDIFEIVRQFPFPTNKPIVEWEVDYIMKNCKQLESGDYYIDYFADYDDLVGGIEGITAIHYTKLRDIIVNGLQLPKESNAYEKYCWAAGQFNLTAKNYGLDKIVLNIR